MLGLVSCQRRLLAYSSSELARPLQYFLSTLTTMPVARHTPSPPASPRPHKRAKLAEDDNDNSTESALETRLNDSWRIPVDYTNGVVLAPMVRSGSRKKVYFLGVGPILYSPAWSLVPTRLLSLKYGASLVWSPEIVDKAIIGCERIVNGMSLAICDNSQVLTLLN